MRVLRSRTTANAALKLSVSSAIIFASRVREKGAAKVGHLALTKNQILHYLLMYRVNVIQRWDGYGGSSGDVGGCKVSAGWSSMEVMSKGRTGGASGFPQL